MIDAITLQFVGAKGLASDIIEWFSQGVVAHVDAVMDDGSLLGARDDEVGGKPSGVWIRPANYMPFERVVRVVLPAPTIIVERFYGGILAEVGKPYDSEGLIANFVFGRDWRDPCAWWCSELHGAKLEQCGYFPTPLATPSNKLTPAGLLLACSGRVPVYMS